MGCDWHIVISVSAVGFIVENLTPELVNISKPYRYLFFLYENKPMIFVYHIKTFSKISIEVPGPYGIEHDDNVTAISTNKFQTCAFDRIVTQINNDFNINVHTDAITEESDEESDDTFRYTPFKENSFENDSKVRYYTILTTFGMQRRSATIKTVEDYCKYFGYDGYDSSDS